MMSFAASGHRSFLARRGALCRYRVTASNRHFHPGRRAGLGRWSPLVSKKQSTRRLVAVGAEDDSQGSMSGEWPMNWSFASYEDLSEYYGGQLLKEEGMGSYHLSDIMTKEGLILTTPETTRRELVTLFEEHTGLPVVDEHGRLMGVVSRSDLNRKGDSVKDLMSTPPIAAKPTARVADAACLMLKHKVHRIPIVGPDAKVLGFVTRTDIFEALEAETEMSESTS